MLSDPLSQSQEQSSHVTVYAVIPAFNEAGRIGAVLDTLAASPEIDTILVVDDGSVDDTFAVASAHPAVQGKQPKLNILRLPSNQGKGAAMLLGAETARDANVLLFFDADLIGLKRCHITDILAPVLAGDVVMSVGVFRGGRSLPTLAHMVAPNISGQRAIQRDIFLAVPDLGTTGYGVELVLTNHIFRERLPMIHVPLRGVTHPIKEEKLGFFLGTIAQMTMYGRMLPYLLQRYR